MHSGEQGQRALWDNLSARRERLLAPPTLNLDYWAGPTPRDMQEVATLHGYTLDEFLDTISGKIVLDVGSGLSALNHEAACMGVKTQIVAIDVPGAYFDRHTGQRQTIRTGQEVIGLAQALPFSDNSFDLVVSTFALPVHATSREQIDGFINEGLRVLKLGGKFLMSPIQIWQGNNLETKEVVNAHFLAILEDLHNSSDYQVTLIAPGRFFAEAAGIEKL